MNQGIQKLSEKRKNWVKANRENGFEDGIKRLLTDLYPDNAHFIYELLQNAEDAQATEVMFILEENRIEFEHNGSRLFDMNDIDSITSIGVSSKKNDPTNIGKFGVGFKAVFAYTSTPEIVSGKYHFNIRDLVVPEAISLPDNKYDREKTRFIFPFDNSKKSPEKARFEIERNLRHLNENTLLFLNNISKIEYLLPNESLGVLERKDSIENRVEILLQRPEESSFVSSYFLKFEKEIDIIDENGMEKLCRISIAFHMEKNQKQDANKNGENEFRNTSAIDQWKIVPLSPGRVSIFFPADKETSNLKFNLHAPFASTVSRDSIRDCDANYELRDGIAELVAESMPAIRDMGLLSVDFLRLLPNKEDELSDFYIPIQNRLIQAFQNRDLTPMKNGAHSAAVGKYRGSSKFSNLINDDDLAMILGENSYQPMWISNPTQLNNREDNFLTMLDINHWKTENLVTALSYSERTVTNLMKGKSDEWHQQLYNILGEYFSKLPTRYGNTVFYNSDAREQKERLCKLRIVRLINNSYSVGSKCYFPSDGVECDELLPQVSSRIYLFGNNKNQQENARKFLKEIGVREVGDAEQVKAILKQRYSYLAERPKNETYFTDLKKFIHLVNDKTPHSTLFANYYIFKRSDKKWSTPNDVYLHLPFLDTGLNVYYEELGNKADEWPLDKEYYCKAGFKLEDIGIFAKIAGAVSELNVKKMAIPTCHPKYDELIINSPGGWSREYGINQDYSIEAFSCLLDNPSIAIAKLVWRTMCSLPTDYLLSQYRNNSHYRTCEAPSTLVYDLRNAEWVPQNSWDDLTFVCPCNASVEKLPKGFSYEKGKKWLEIIKFGDDIRQRELQVSQEYQNKKQAAKTLGFNSLEEAEEIADLKRKDPDGFKKWQGSNNQKPSFPENNSRNPERRAERTWKGYEDAPIKTSEEKMRTIRVSTPFIVPKTYLNDQYTNDDNQLICQMCEMEMPFKLRDRTYYFESVQLFDDSPREAHQIYLALCPICSAKYALLVKKHPESIKSVKDAITDIDPSDSNCIHIDLNSSELEPITIRFTETHLSDIKTIIT